MPSIFVYLSFIKRQLRNVTRIDIVLDVYLKDSLKSIDKLNRFEENAFAGVLHLLIQVQEIGRCSLDWQTRLNYSTSWHIGW